MPFRDDPTKRPLYDTLDGGPPRAWECKIEVNWTEIPKHKDDGEDYLQERVDFYQRPIVHIEPCGKIFKTLKGIRQHQKQVHKFEEQGELDGRADEAGDARPGGEIQQSGPVDDRRDPETLPSGGVPSHQNGPTGKNG